MFKFVYGILPAIISYTDDMSEDFAGITKRFIIKIRLKNRNDNGLLQHELVHVKQWYRTFMLHSLLYNLSKKYRLNSEIEAYIVQLKVNKEEGKEDYIDFYAKRITEIYNLSLTTFEVKEILEDGLL